MSPNYTNGDIENFLQFNRWDSKSISNNQNLGGTSRACACVLAINVEKWTFGGLVKNEGWER